MGTTQLEIEVEGLPPSVNTMYVRSGKHVYKPSKARDWQKYVRRELQKVWEDKPPLNSELELKISYETKDHRRWDIDNRVKSLQDCLQEAGVIADDRLIERLEVERKYGNKNATKLRLKLLTGQDEDDEERSRI